MAHFGAHWIASQVTALLAGLALLFGPPRPVLHSQGDQVTAGRGSYCWAGDQDTNGLEPSICADAFGPAPVSDGALPVRGDGQVRVDMRTETEVLSATLRGRAGALVVNRGAASGFLVRLPRRLDPGAVLDLRAVYPKGTGSFAARLDVPPPPAPPKPLLRAGADRLTMARGSYCWHTPPLGLCVDARPPTTAHALTVGRDGVVRGDLRLAADVIGASIVGRPPDLRVRRTGGSRRRFAIRLPTYPDDRLVLRLFVRYPEGDASFGARLRVG
jgi:hypothetical protein